MKKSTTHQTWLLAVIGAVIPLTLILGSELHIPQRITLPILITAILIFSAMAMWTHANANANGHEWWQDNSSTGWRGY